MTQAAEAIAVNVLDPIAHIDTLGQRAREAAAVLARLPRDRKDAALNAMAAALREQRDAILDANAEDMDRGRKGGLSAALLDRLELTPARLESMAAGLENIALQDDPIGSLSASTQRPSGLEIARMRVPLGVIGVIYESRPNVTADAAGICLKSGNAVILRGGKEAFASNQAIAACLQQGLRAAELPEQAVQLVATTDRAAVGALLAADRYLDVIIPRGGKGLVSRIAEEARVPVIKHLDGICHVYIDDGADADQARDIAVNSKTYRYGICGAMETLLIAKGEAEAQLPGIVKALRDKGVEVRGCAQTRAILPDTVAATEEDWDTEYLAPILSVRVVDGIDQAIAHIAEHGSHHTDAIVTQHLERSRRFMREVDSSSVMVNASTCFADGAEYGLGAEIGISTDRLHVRGPVGVQGLTTEKYVVIGQGTVR